MMSSYVVRYDIGFAPNPFYGWCSLACCKPDIRKATKIGDMVIGTSSTSGGRQTRFVYAMRVKETLDFQSYWIDGRFLSKRPNLSGSKKQLFGDNIYHQDVSGQWLQEDSRHSKLDGSRHEQHFLRDTKVNRVLLSDDFIYWGGVGHEIPSQFLHGDYGDDIVKSGQGKKNNFCSFFVKEFEDWFDRQDKGFKGQPTDWSEDILKKQLL